MLMAGKAGREASASEGGRNASRQMRHVRPAQAKRAWTHSDYSRAEIGHRAKRILRRVRRDSDETFASERNLFVVTYLGSDAFVQILAKPIV
jgi:hypothetical protein